MLTVRAAGVAILAAALAVAPAVAAAPSPTRYSLAGGCYTATDASGNVVAKQARMQATALGRYLLYTPERKFVTAAPDGTMAPADAASPAADFAVVEAPGGGFTLIPQAT